MNHAGCRRRVHLESIGLLTTKRPKFHLVHLVHPPGDICASHEADERSSRGTDAVARCALLW